MRGMTRDTLVEMVSRRLLLLYAIVTALTVGMLLLSLLIDFSFEVNHPDGTTDMINEVARTPLMNFFGGFVGFMVFLTVMATAGLFPRMLRRGTADYYLSKPLSRVSLFLNRLFGIWFVYFGVIVVSGLVIMLTMLATYGLWEWHLFYFLLYAGVAFLIWLCITSLLAVMSNSTSLTIMTVFAIWIVQMLLGMWQAMWREAFLQMLESKAIVIIIDTLYYIMPKMSQLSTLGEELVFARPVTSWLPLWSSLLFALAMLLISLYLFRRKDF